MFSSMSPCYTNAIAQHRAWSRPQPSRCIYSRRKQGLRIPHAKGDRPRGNYDKWKQSKKGSGGSQSQDPSKKGPPRPRTNIPPPSTISLNPSGRPTPATPPEPPPRNQGKNGNFLSDLLFKTVTAFPGFREVARTNDPMEKWFDENPRRRSPAYGDWAADIEVGDDWDYRPGGSDFTYQADTRARYPNTNTPRDSFMRPIADPIGVADRLSFDRGSRERRLDEEASLNRQESRVALVFAGLWLFLIPFGFGFLVSRGLAEPIITYVQESNPDRLQLTDKMKKEGARVLRQEVLRLRMEANIGKAPPLTDEELFYELQHKAHEYEHEKQEEIRVGLVNIISDSVTIVTFGVILTMRADGRQALTNTIGRISQGMSQTGKAFILILAADVLMGYHSEEGWTAGIEILSEHYMVEVGKGPIAIFVSTVPVILDTAFKWWLFKGLNRIDPSASVTLSEIDRH